MFLRIFCNGCLQILFVYIWMQCGKPCACSMPFSGMRTIQIIVSISMCTRYTTVVPIWVELKLYMVSYGKQILNNTKSDQWYHKTLHHINHIYTNPFIHKRHLHMNAQTDIHTHTHARTRAIMHAHMHNCSNPNQGPTTLDSGPPPHFLTCITCITSNIKGLGDKTCTTVCVRSMV